MQAPPLKPARTTADYLAMAVGPVLIMCMVGSLVFFLLEVGYRGRFAGHAGWILFWFTVASVLVSRISIEQGSAYGTLYGVALGLATAFRLTQLFGFQLVPLLLLALIWWCASKLTWDCTLIDEDEDASGEGLWQRTRLYFSGFAAATSDRGEEAPPSAAPPTEPAGKKRAHAPGLWVVYFSLAALPVFGLGQLTLASGDEGTRSRTFLLLCLYLAAAFGLLLTTSFLGLRRYLRQRHLAMPAAMARFWMARGITVALGVLIVALLLPRPQGADSLAGLVTRLDSVAQKASDHAMTRGDAAEGDGRALGEESESGNSDEGRSGKEPGQEGEAEAGSSEGRDKETQGAGGTRSEGNGKKGESGSSRSSTGSGQPRGSTSVSVSQADLADWLRPLMYLLGAIILLIAILRFGKQWLAILAKGRSKRPRPPSTPAAPAARTPAFAAFSNPFTTGIAKRMTSAQLIAYTFEALQAWANDKGWPRRMDQTPAEFAQELSGRAPEMTSEVLGTVRLYVQLAYAGTTSAPVSTHVLERLWSSLGRRS